VRAALSHNELASRFANFRDNIPPNFPNPARLVRIRMRDEPITSGEAGAGKNSLQFRITLRSVVVKDADAVSGADRLDLADNAAAFVSAGDQFAEGRGIVQGTAVDNVVDVGNQQVSG
jgi:hypothetical protein